CALLRMKFKEDLFTYCIENGILEGLLDTSESSNDNTNVVNTPQEPFVVKQDPGAHYGYNCPLKVSFIPDPEPCNNQTIDELPQTLPSFDPTCYSGDENLFTYDSKSNIVDDSPNIPIYYDDEDDEESSTPLRDIIISEHPPCIAITPILSTKEPKDSLIMGGEHLDTILEKESNEFIKSSVENLVPNPNDDDESFSDEDVPKKIYSNPLFDEEIISIKRDPHHFNAESDLIESFLNQDSSIIYYSKIDSLLDEFAGELIFLKSIPLGIDEADCDPEEEIRLIKKLFYDNSSFPPLEDFNSENSDAIIESFSPSSIPVEAFHFVVPSSSRPSAKPPDDGIYFKPNMGLLTTKVPDDDLWRERSYLGSSVSPFLSSLTSSSMGDRVLSLAWETILEIEHAFEDKHCQLEDILKLFRRLHNDVQNIHEELAVYINTPSWDHPTICYNDDDDEDCTIAITLILSTEEPDNSLSMGDEHLDTILVTESDEVIKSIVENLVLILSKSEGIPDNMCDVPFHDNFPPLDISKDQFEDFFDSNEDSTSIDDDYFSIDNIEYVEASPPDAELISLELMELLSRNGSTTTRAEISLPDYEAFYDDHVKEISSGSTTTHSNFSLYNSFIFNLSNNLFPPADMSDFYEFADELAVTPPFW
nr:hypothetical protein [Tanacetum cinerariifolium]